MPAKNGILKGTGRGETRATMVTCIVAGVCGLGRGGGREDRLWKGGTKAGLWASVARCPAFLPAAAESH